MMHRSLAELNLKFIKYAGPIMGVILLLNIIFFAYNDIYYLSVFMGMAGGLMLGCIAPILWKHEKEATGMLFSLSLLLLIPAIVSRLGVGYPHFHAQYLLICLLTVTLVWLLGRSYWLEYLKSNFKE